MSKRLLKRMMQISQIVAPLLIIRNSSICHLVVTVIKSMLKFDTKQAADANKPNIKTRFTRVEIKRSAIV